MTVELTTSEPDAFLPINLTNLFMARRHIGTRSSRPCRPRSRTRRACQAGLGGVRRRPVGLGPFRVMRFSPRERLELARTRLLGREAPAEDRSRGAPAAALRRTPARRRSCRARSTGSRPRPRTRAADQEPRLRDLPERATPCVALGSSPSSRARPGSTNGCARPPISASTGAR
jgi:hypothetical protein